MERQVSPSRYPDVSVLQFGSSSWRCQRISRLCPCNGRDVCGCMGRIVCRVETKMLGFIKQALIFMALGVGFGSLGVGMLWNKQKTNAAPLPAGGDEAETHRKIQPPSIHTLSNEQQDLGAMSQQKERPWTCFTLCIVIYIWAKWITALLALA